MRSLDILVDNIHRLSIYYNLHTYADIAKFLGVNESSLKRWQNKSRCPSLKRIDQLGDRIGCYSYALVQREGDVFSRIECMHNDSRRILVNNLNRIFIEEGRKTWNDKVALFYGFVSEDVLKSYFRKKGYKTPTLGRLDEMAEAIGKPVYDLLKEVNDNEKADSRGNKK